jgi:hypothetical protein
MHEVPECAKLDCSELDYAEPNQALHCQVVMYKQTKEQSTPVVTLTQSPMFETLSIILFFTKEDVSEASSISIFKQRST